MVYTRAVNGKELTFGVSGKLYKDALVMFDRETETLWTQVDGSVLRGKLEGSRLQPVPAMQTTWSEWKRLHPETLVLKKDPGVRGTPYADYFADPQKMGIAGTRNPDERLPGKAMVVTLREESEALAIKVDALKVSLLHQTALGGQPLAVVYSPAGGSACVFDRRVEGETLDFTAVRRGEEVLLRDRQTSTLWSGLTGKALEGKLAGRELRAVPHMMNYWFAWAAYNPRTRLEP